MKLFYYFFYCNYRWAMGIRNVNHKPFFEGMELVGTCSIMAITFAILLLSVEVLFQTHSKVSPLNYIRIEFGRKLVMFLVMTLIFVLPYLFLKSKNRYQHIIDNYEDRELFLKPYLVVVLCWFVCALPMLIVFIQKHLLL